MAFFGSRVLTLLPLVALPIVTAADVGSIALVHLAVPDDAAEAGRAAMSAIQYQSQPTSNAAQIAFDAAASVADLHQQEIDRRSFTIYKNGSVHLSVSRDAPTVMFKRIPFLRDLTHASATTTIERPTW